MVASSCRPEEVAPNKPTFTFIYQAINEGSETISSMNLSTATIYADENSTYLAGIGNNIFYDKYEENHLFPYDAIIIPTDSVYVGCIVSMTVKVAHLVKNGEFEQERFITYSKLDTVRTVADSAMTIVWPKDSVLFKSE